MTRIRIGVDLLFALAATAGWTFVALVFGSRFISDTAGGLLAMAVFVTGMAITVGGHVQELRFTRLAAGICPRCGARIASEHRHRRWEPERNQWVSPTLSWECSACGFSHSDVWACERCPAAD